MIYYFNQRFKKTVDEGMGGSGASFGESGGGEEEGHSQWRFFFSGLLIWLTGPHQIVQGKRRVGMNETDSGRCEGMVKRMCTPRI